MIPDQNGQSVPYPTPPDGATHTYIAYQKHNASELIKGGTPAPPPRKIENKALPESRQAAARFSRLVNLFSRLKLVFSSASIRLLINR